MRSEEDKKRIGIQIEKVKYAYNQLRTMDLRNDYNTILDSQVVERRLKLPCLRRNVKNVTFHNLQNRNGEIIEIKETGRIDYTNFSSVFKSYVSEYMVKRMVNGKEKQDYIYGNLFMIDLSINKNTGKPINPEYYDLIVNKVLSEESIETCSKYNHGYIGEIEKTKQGYERTFNNIEQISAVMKVYGERDMKHKKSDQELGG